MTRAGDRQRRSSPAPQDEAGATTNSDQAETAELCEELSYLEAQTALELALAQLRDSNLPVETMGDLYRRALAYAQRCEQLLNQVEQSVDIWDPEQEQTGPRPMEG